MSRAPASVMAAVLVAGFLGLLLWGFLTREPSTAQSGRMRVGNPAPEVALTLFDGDEFALSEQRGQVVVINFWASWCPPCRAEAALLERTWREYKDRDVVFLGINVQDARPDALTYLQEFDVTYPNGPDGNGRISIDYGLSGLPLTLFIDRDGIVQRRWVGAVFEKQLAAWIEELIVGQAMTEEVEGSNPEQYYEFEN